MKLFYRNHNQILTDIAKEFEIVEDMNEADIVILWNEVLPETKALIQKAKDLGKKVIALQHGRRGSSRYFPPFNEQIVSDKLCVWGPLDKERLVAVGHDKNKIEVVGTTVFSHLKGRVPHKGINIVFSPDHWNREIPENINVRNELRKLKGVNIITKIIDEQEPLFYDNPVRSDRKKPDHLDVCAEVLSKADLVVSVAEGTFELLAQSMDIPVITVEDWEPKEFGGDPRYKTYWRHISPAAKRTKLKNLLKNIKQQLSNPDELKEDRKKMCIQEGGINLDCIYEIKKAIASIQK
jgi:hypothetical protein